MHFKHKDKKEPKNWQYSIIKENFDDILATEKPNSLEVDHKFY
jgi:hypothetical protein